MVSFNQRQQVSRFQNAPKANFFLQPHLLTLPKLDVVGTIEAKPLLRVWNFLFLGFMVSSAFGLYAHASLNELATVPNVDGGASNLPTYELAMRSEPLDKTSPLKPLTETVQELAVIDQLPDVSDQIVPNTAQDSVKQLLSQPTRMNGNPALNPLPISTMGALRDTSHTTLLDDGDFVPSIDESGLLPSKNVSKASKPGPLKPFNLNKPPKNLKTAQKSPFDYEPEDEGEEDERLINKILSKPRIAVGMPQIIPKSRPLPDVDDLIKPSSRYGTRASVIESASFMSPLRRLTISSRYGWRYGRMHAGIDLAAPTGSDILAVKGGIVIHSGWQGGYGKTVIIDHGDGRQTRYAHCHRLFVAEGQHVTQGDRIALVGNTGHSTGSHLHFEVLVHGIAKNPENFLFR